MADELIDIFDQNNNLLNESKLRSVVHKIGLWHRTVHICIYNSKGEILIQLRSNQKESFPGLWDVSVAGHIGAGEEAVISALREIEEEIGLQVKEEDLEFFKIRKVKGTFGTMINREFYYIYLMKFDGDINSLKLQKNEVDAVRFLSLDKIEEDLKNNPNEYVPHRGYWFELINKVRNKLNYKKNHQLINNAVLV